MDALIILFSAMSVIGICIALWINTKQGKKWIKGL